MKRISDTGYQPQSVYHGLVEEGGNDTPVTFRILYAIHAFCLDPDKYGAGNPDGNDLRVEGLDWVQMTWEFIRGGMHDELTDPREDHLLAYDPDSGFWHPIDSNVKDRLALDYTMQYSDVVIETSLVIAPYEEGGEEG